MGASADCRAVNKANAVDKVLRVQKKETSDKLQKKAAEHCF